MKIDHGIIEDETVLKLKEIFCNTVLETAEGNQIAICMRDDTIELSVIGSELWYRADMQTGLLEEM